MTNSIIHPKFEGTLVLISGLHGLGKTTLAMTMENPALTGMIDFDLKGRALANELGLAWYQSPEHTGSPDDYDVKKLGDWFLKTLAAIPNGINHLIIDNATWAEAGLAQRVLQNPAKYGVNAKNAQAGIYGGANPGITVLWANIFTFLQNKGVKVVTAINHMSQPWIDGKPAPNKFNVKGNKVFNQIASLAVILTPANPERGGKPPIPSGLIIKEALSLTKWDNKKSEFTTVKALPARLPVCTWKNIVTYFSTPASFDSPAPGEEWTRAEVDSYSEWLSPEQVAWVMKVKSYSDEDTTLPEVEPIQEQSKTEPKPEPATESKPHWATIPEDREKAVTILNDRGIPLWALFDRYGVKSFDELAAKPLTDVGKDVLNNTINYWTKANEAQKFFLMIQDITKGYYNHPNHLWQVVGKFDPANKDAQWSAATDHATKSRAEKAAGKAATDQERAEQAIKEIEAITEEMPF